MTTQIDLTSESIGYFEAILPTLNETETAKLIVAAAALQHDSQKETEK